MSTMKLEAPPTSSLAIPESVWDEVATSLHEKGYATVPLGPETEICNAGAFGAARQAFDRLREFPDDASLVLRIPPDADSTHATGYHTAGGENSLSRYNAHREGFVFSDDNWFGVNDLPHFQPTMVRLSGQLHEISRNILEAFERRLELPVGWFQDNLGPTHTSSQFHVKRYVPGDDKLEPATNGDPEILLPVHTDPSLISVIIHDAKGCNPSAMGLQCFVPSGDETAPKRVWEEVPFHGHGVAVVFVGSVLSYITGNYFPPIKHRVIRCDKSAERIAATLFVRPQLQAGLQPPPNTRLSTQVKSKGTFAQWITRVSRNYGKNKKT